MKLTPLGKEMAALPIEPQTARMLLQAHQESVLSEMLVIAAGLSIQDPRDFPTEEKEKARQMHSSFVSRESDYITLLSIWRAYQARWNELKTENKMQKVLSTALSLICANAGVERHPSPTQFYLEGFWKVSPKISASLASYRSKT